MPLSGRTGLEDKAVSTEGCGDFVKTFIDHDLCTGRIGERGGEQD